MKILLYYHCYTYHMYMYRAYCIILYFYTSCHIKEKCVEFLLFESFCFLGRTEKTWFLYVTSIKGFLEFCTDKTNKQNKEYL